MDENFDMLLVCEDLGETKMSVDKKEAALKASIPFIIK